jgi:hypothetical protein
MRAIYRSWPRIAVGLAVAGILAAGCGGGGGGGETQEVTAPPLTGSPSNPNNRAPAITGAPPVAIVVGQQYSFQPQATDADNDPITFAIANKPAWATFDASTGRLTGVPAGADVGVHEGIAITATDGSTSSSLPEFSVIVSPTGTVNASLSIGWQPPTENDDGTPLVDLAGYRIHYGNASRNYSGTIAIDNPSTSEFQVKDLPPGSYYFAVTATNSEGNESAHSVEVTADIES